MCSTSLRWVGCGWVMCWHLGCGVWAAGAASAGGGMEGSPGRALRRWRACPRAWPDPQPRPCPHAASVRSPRCPAGGPVPRAALHRGAARAQAADAGADWLCRPARRARCPAASAGPPGPALPHRVHEGAAFHPSARLPAGAPRVPPGRLAAGGLREGGRRGRQHGACGGRHSARCSFAAGVRHRSAWVVLTHRLTRHPASRRL